MKFPKHCGFDLTCGITITVVLDDLVTLTGKFLGKRHKHHSHKKCHFILIQLTCPFCEKDGPKIPEGTIVAIKVEHIRFITPGLKCQDKKQDGPHVINICCKRNDDDCR